MRSAYKLLDNGMLGRLSGHHGTLRVRRMAPPRPRPPCRSLLRRPPCRFMHRLLREMPTGSTPLSTPFRSAARMISRPFHSHSNGRVLPFRGRCKNMLHGCGIQYNPPVLILRMNRILLRLLVLLSTAPHVMRKLTMLCKLRQI